MATNLPNAKIYKITTFVKEGELYSVFYFITNKEIPEVIENDLLDIEHKFDCYGIKSIEILEGIIQLDMRAQQLVPDAI